MEKNHVFTLRNIPDTYAIHDYVTEHNPVSCAVIGAGFIGLEMAENLAEQGLKVSVVEGASHVMPPIDMDMAHGVHNYIRSKGIDLYLGQTCTAMDGSGVILKNGAKVPADMVIMSIGVRPDTGFLKDSGIELGARGEIIVNTYMETSAADVYALGDAVSAEHVVSGQKVLIPLASPANKQGRIVGDNLCGKKTAYKGSQGTSVMKFFDMTVAVTGEKEESLKAQEEAAAGKLPPQMGWSTWNFFREKINEEKAMDAAKALVNTNLNDHGYVYFNLDDCWQSNMRDENGRMQFDLTGFPSGPDSSSRLTRSTRRTRSR